MLARPSPGGVGDSSLAVIALLPSAANTALLVAPDGVLAVVVAGVAVCGLFAAESRSSRPPFMLTLALDDRRCLRLLEKADAEELCAVVQANRAYLARWMPWAEKQTLDGTLEFGRASRKQLAENQGFAVAVVEADAIVGVLGYHRLRLGASVEQCRYWMTEQSQGNGTVTRATAALVDHAFGVWKLNRVEIRAGVETKRSRAIPERLGFTQGACSMIYLCCAGIQIALPPPMSHPQTERRGHLCCAARRRLPPYRACRPNICRYGSRGSRSLPTM